MADESLHEDRGVSPRTQPKTRAEWQTAVDAAHGALCLHAARAYGLVTGGPEVNVERCEEVLRLGKARRIKPAHDSPERFIHALLAQGVG